MQGHIRATILIASALVVTHVAATAAHGLVLTDGLRERVGASPETTLTRPWSLLIAPFFHDDLFHLGYNLLVLALVLPWGLEAVGVTRGLTAAYLASPVSVALVNLLLILPLAAAGWGWAQAAVEPRLVGSSVAIFAAAGLALGTRGWSPTLVAGVTATYLVYETILAATGTTRAFVGVYHSTGFLVGLALAYLGPW